MIADLFVVDSSVGVKWFVPEVHMASIGTVRSGRTETEREWRDPPSQQGYAFAFDAAVAFINSQLPQNEPIGQAFRTVVRMYPEKAIRELVANALIHQDFSVTGTGPMVEIFTDRIEITNPGEPLVDTLRFIDAAPKSRNEALAAFMRRMNICEEAGTGIDKAISAIEAFQLPAPDFKAVLGFTRTFLYASRWKLPATAQDSLPAAGPALPDGIGYPQGSFKRFHVCGVPPLLSFLAQCPRFLSVPVFSCARGRSSWTSRPQHANRSSSMMWIIPNRTTAEHPRTHSLRRSILA
jgi:hypothetical protein